MLERAEEAAGIDHLEGGAFHPFRRMWATERKHLPDKDVAAAGGWRDIESLRKSYQQVDEKTLLQVMPKGHIVRSRVGRLWRSHLAWSFVA